MQQDTRREASVLLRQSAAGDMDKEAFNGSPLLKDVKAGLFSEQAAYRDVMDRV